MAENTVRVHVDGHLLTLSNLDKVLYPAAGFTKGEVIDYYSRVAPVLRVARTCMATSSSWPSAASNAIVTMERSRRLSVGRDQTCPQAASVISC